MSTTAGLQERVQERLDALVASGSEVGLQAAVVHRGELVVDAVSGVADPASGAPVTPATLFYAASTAKGVASTVAHVLAERGDLGYDLRAVDVWPAFGARGKEGVTLRHVLLHTAGVPALPHGWTVDDLCDWDATCAALADAEPWWEPGTRFGYHALTFGFLLGELVRRATGRTLRAALREVATGPLGIADDVHFGVPAQLLPRVATQVAPPSPGPGPAPGAPADRAIPPGVRPDAALANRRDVLMADIPSAGTMTARGAATLYAALLGHVPGVPLVGPERLQALAAVAFQGRDEVMGVESSWAFGYAPFRPGATPSRPGSSFGMVGMNGSAAYADLDSGVAVAVLRNRFDGDLTAAAAVDDAVVAALAPG